MLKNNKIPIANFIEYIFILPILMFAFVFIIYFLWFMPLFVGFLTDN